MNKTLSILALTGSLVLGGLVGYDIRERNATQATAPATTTNAVTSAATTGAPASQGQMVQTLAQSYDNARARTESEANTVQIVKERRDGLVYISVTEGDSSSAQAQLRQRLQQQLPFDLGQGDQEQKQTGTGSGFFVTGSGDIITNNHVVEGASEITVRLHGSKTTYMAKVVARAPDFDLALIRAEGVPASEIKALPLGDSSQLDVGLKAIAMGAPFGLDFSVSEGIISSLERQVPVGTKGVNQNVIQTDAAINPGNSGGPLLNSAGQVIGVNTQILTGGIGQSAGVGFAIPVNTVKKLLPELQAGKGTVIQTPSLGVGIGDVASLSAAARKQAKLPERGVLIGRVYQGSPAAAAGLKGSRTVTDESIGQRTTLPGDVITAVDGQPLAGVEELPQQIISRRIGETVTLTVVRDGQTRDVKVTLKAFDLAAAAQREDGQGQ
ncbi:trypsin-like serine protease [Deinococcus grandis]|uniref:Trypsin-like serine protease n=1 Tax=Deinococcus grandis TaxID=57498 RepID=A0A117DNJ2_9DEIO|nr:trypsin-like peptidase domain-containing protein [Deinococcus grandis]BBN94771.1 serine protease [Deinococcus grandis]GAQ21732.1 trypsin-like serine protease [Deinococcus grandis]